MKTNLNPHTPSYKNISKKYYPKLRPLTRDTVSFGAMSKSRFSGIDFLILNKFKAPVEKFNSNADFQLWCKNIINREYISKKQEFAKSDDEQTQIQRTIMLNEWIEYITKENDDYTPAIQLMILSSITSGLDGKANRLPPNLDKGVLAETIYEIKNNCKKDKSYDCNFAKLYGNKLQMRIFDEEPSLDESLSGWIVIPSKENDPENFEENVRKLQTLSHPSWCTKTNNAEPYLSKGDFHIYIDEGKPRLGVRFVGDEIGEIQGKNNNSRIPLEYFDIVKKHIEENGFMLSPNTMEKFEKAQEAKAKLDKFKNSGLDFKNSSAKEIFDFFGVKYEENEDGKLILESYEQPDEDFSYEDLGLSENRLFEDIVEVKGDLDLQDSNITDLGALRLIGGSALFDSCKLKTLGNLQSIGGNAYFGASKITDLGALQSIGGNAYFEYSKNINLANLISIGGHADFRNSEIISLAKLRSIGGMADFRYSEIVDLGDLEEIGEYAHFEDSKVVSLCKLKSIKGKNIGNAKTPQDLKMPS